MMVSSGGMVKLALVSAEATGCCCSCAGAGVGSAAALAAVAETSGLGCSRKPMNFSLGSSSSISGAWTESKGCVALPPAHFSRTRHAISR